jgi:hypothetical protein
MSKHLLKTTFLVLFITNLSYCQDSTKKSTGFKAILERRQERLNKIINKQNEVSAIEQKQFEAKSPGEYLRKGGNSLIASILVSGVGIGISALSNDIDIKKYAIIGTSVASATLLIIGFDDIAKAGKLFKLKGL